MTETPDQIEGASFSTVKRGGYRTEEVDDFLRKLADEHRSLQQRVSAAEGANEDLQAASAEMASLMRDVHAQLGEKRRQAENEVAEIRNGGERDAATIIAAATEQADGIRQQADRVLSDAEHHAELLRSDGEQRVREKSHETLRAARSELQDLLRKKHEVLHSLSALRSDLVELEAAVESSSISPDSLDDSIIGNTLIDLRDQERPPAPSLASMVPSPPIAAPDSGEGHPSSSGSGSFFAPLRAPAHPRAERSRQVHLACEECSVDAERWLRRALSE